jgi:D-glycero-alpha-D-manno-heptose-7-phosphate kinase
MIVTKTPLRVSFFSGGSDMPSFYTKEPGAALSATIDKYIYVSVHKTPRIGIKVMYDEVEKFNDVEEMHQSITSESLKYFSIHNECTISSVSDILSKGSGLGSSSAFTVGLVNALAHMRNVDNVTREYLANTACDIEMNKCEYPVGKQDQYAAAYGGFNLFKFDVTGNVTSQNVAIDRSTWKNLESRLLLVYSGVGRSANGILQKQQSAMNDKSKFDLVRLSRDKAIVGTRYLMESRLDDFGSLLHDAWMDKKEVAADITNERFDMIYNEAMASGSLGGKLLGAGGGGFFLFYAPPDKIDSVADNVTRFGCKVYPFKFTDTGSRVVASC